MVHERRNRPLIIIGAGGFAREVRDILDFLGIPTLGYVVDPEYRTQGDIDGLPILGDLSYGAGDGSVEYILAVAEPSHRYEIWKRHTYLCPGAGYATAINPSVQIGRASIVENGSVICGNVIMTNHVVINAHTHVNLGCTIGHDAVIGEFVTLSPGVHVSGNVVMGKGTFVGSGAVIAEKIRIGAWCHIGAGAVILQDIPDNATAVGVPAKVIRKRDNGWQNG